MLLSNLGRKLTEGTGSKTPYRRNPMNTLALIQKQLQRQAKVEAYNKSIAYRGVKYEPNHDVEDRTGCFVYRGRTYCK